MCCRDSGDVRTTENKWRQIKSIIYGYPQVSLLRSTCSTQLADESNVCRNLSTYQDLLTRWLQLYGPSLLAVEKKLHFFWDELLGCILPFHCLHSQLSEKKINPTVVHIVLDGLLSN